MFASILILALYLAVPVTLATAALFRHETGMRKEAVPAKVLARQTHRSCRLTAEQAVQRAQLPS
jgi:hypothetical protein